MSRTLLFLFLCMVACRSDIGDPEGPTDAGEDAPIAMRSATIDTPEVVVQFDADQGEAPESVAIDGDNNKYISLALTGEIRKVSADGDQSTVAVLPLGQCAPDPFPAILGAIAINIHEDLFVGAATCDPADRGIYRVSLDGSFVKIAALPEDALPNGIAVHLGHVYVADSGAPRVWRAPVDGNGEDAEVWLEDPLLADPDPTDLAPGANGLQFYLDRLYVANAGAATIVAIDLTKGDNLADLQPDGTWVKYGPPGSGAAIEVDYPGCDDFAFDLIGRIYCTTDPFQSVVLLDPYARTAKTILTAEDGLDGPTAAAFGRYDERYDLYITNAAFPFFPSTGNGPSLMRLAVPIPAYPLR